MTDKTAIHAGLKVLAFRGGCALLVLISFSVLFNLIPWRKPVAPVDPVTSIGSLIDPSPVVLPAAGPAPVAPPVPAAKARKPPAKVEVRATKAPLPKPPPSRLYDFRGIDG